MITKTESPLPDHLLKKGGEGVEQYFAAFAQKEGLQKRIYNQNGLRLLLISRLTEPDLSPKAVTQYLDEALYYEKRWGDACCVLVAQDAVNKRLATGLLDGSGLRDSFSGWTVHTLNYHHLQEGGYLALDFTSGVNVDRKQGYFNLLALGGDSLAQVIDDVTKLYGGTWRPSLQGTKKHFEEVDRLALQSY
jgi:hypothetical protein